LPSSQLPSLPKFNFGAAQALPTRCTVTSYNHLETPESLDMVYTWYILGIYF